MSAGRQALLVLVVALAGLSGCGGSGGATTGSPAPAVTAPATTPVVQLDTKRVALAIQQSILVKRGVDATVVCPGKVRQQQGLSFDCVATTAAGRTTFRVQQSDDAGNVSYAAQ